MNEFEKKFFAEFKATHGREPNEKEQSYILNLTDKIQQVIDKATFDFDWFNQTGDMTYTK